MCKILRMSKFRIDRVKREQIESYLISNPIDRTIPRPYEAVAKKFDIDEEYVRGRNRKMREKGLVIDSAVVENVADKIVQKIKLGQINIKVNEKGEATLNTVITSRIRTKEDLIDALEIDLSIWNIISWEATTWEGYRADKQKDLSWEGGKATGFVKDSGKIVTETLYRVNVKLSPRKVGNDIGLQKEAVLAELRAYSPVLRADYIYEPNQRNCLLEICTFDLHLGSMSWGTESGDNYDIKIAEERFKTSVRELLTRVNLNQVERILFPIGNDLMNVDSKNNTTTNGTVVDTDVRFMKMLKVARRIVSETIDELSLIAPVDVIVVPGNHDATVSLVLGEILDAFYYNNERVTIYSSPRTRKYYEYGIVGIQFTHGNEESHSELGLIFATEQKELWARTIQRFVQIGHFHKNKKISYLSIDEFQGFQVQTLPTLSSVTAWADKKGYSSLKQAKAFIFDREKGLIGEFTTTI